MPAPAAAVHLTLAGRHGAAARHWRVDATHANALGAWQKMGSPARPSADQVAQLQAASRLEAEPLALTGGGADVVIPRQGVALVEIQ